MSAVPSVWMNTLWFRYFACGVRLAPCAAADTDHDGPENVDRIPGILDRRAEADDRQRADHTERQSDVVPDDDHDRCGDERQHRERYVKLHAVYAAADPAGIPEKISGYPSGNHHRFGKISGGIIGIRSR